MRNCASIPPEFALMLDKLITHVQFNLDWTLDQRDTRALHLPPNKSRIIGEVNFDYKALFIGLFASISSSCIIIISILGIPQ